MADMYDATTCSSSSSPEHDDISFFLQQILFRSSSSSALMAHDGKQAQSLSPPHLMPQNPHISNPSPFVSASDRLVKDQISAAESSSGFNSSSGAGFSPSGGQFTATAANVHSSSVGTVDNDGDEYDCESEEGFEALAEEVPARQAPARNHSKRSRAAEVHNLSEKRRRSRINEKMKALQNLIPNSNKTDKASMLDEAIEYLKQLQLQVQMLTMRNGLSLYPMCLPGVLQPNQLSQMRMDFYEGNRSLNMNMTGAVPVNQETMMNTVFSVSNQCSNPNFPSVGNLSSIINSETSFAPQSSIQSHFFQLHPSSEEICREDFLHHRQLNVGHSEANSLEFQMEAEKNMSIPFDNQGSEIKDSTLEACILPRQRSGGAILTNPDCDRVLCHQLNGIDAGPRVPSAPNDDIKTERHNMTS